MQNATYLIYKMQGTQPVYLSRAGNWVKTTVNAQILQRPDAMTRASLVGGKILATVS